MDEKFSPEEKEDIKKHLLRLHELPAEAAADSPTPPRKMSRVQERLVKNHVDIRLDRGEIANAVFQHSILCQTFLPYKDPGEELRVWHHKQGKARLFLKAGEVTNPRTDEIELIGLPYGARARLILAYLNTQAVKTQQPAIDVEQSLSAFIKKLGLHSEGKTIGMIKEQIKRLAATDIKLDFIVSPEQVIQTKFDIVKSFDLWFPTDAGRRMLWNSTIILSDDYFKNLVEHAVPLDERALSALSHNAMAIDIYSWLAQRLHRVRGVEFVPWAALKEQFGFSYKEMKGFKRDFRKTLEKVVLEYPGARIEEVLNRGFNLHNSPPPILKEYFQVPSLGSGKPK